MTLGTFTQSRVSFERTTQAVEAVGDYFSTRSTEAIRFAGSAIDAAIQADPNYAIAIFYRGIIHDLDGTPADAVPYFERILDGSDDASLCRKARFNLGVAYYHQYSHKWLEKAVFQFENVASEDIDDSIAILARAHLTQVHAMWMRLSSAQDKTSQETQRHIRDHFKMSKTNADIVAKTDDKKHEFARAVAMNGQGMANMYITDWCSISLVERNEHLQKALVYLKDAEKVLANDWANTCDIASANLRLGVLARDDNKASDSGSCFQEAHRRLDLVIRKLRPGYGFALFEAGILHRVWGKYEQAVGFLNRAKAVPERYRDISDSKVDVELAAAMRQDRTYPLT